jgi:hypothetical protein
MREYKEISASVPLAGPEDLSSLQLELVLEEADRCLLMVDARIDEPGRRVVDAYPPDDSTYGRDDVAQINLAIALLADAYPALQGEIGFVIDRFRMEGGVAGVRELSRYPHLMDLIRLSLEMLFHLCPTPEDYVEWQAADLYGDVLNAPEDRYSSYVEVYAMLRSRLC